MYKAELKALKQNVDICYSNCFTLVNSKTMYIKPTSLLMLVGYRIKKVLYPLRKSSSQFKYFTKAT